MLKYLPAYLNHLLFQPSYSIRCLSVILVLDVIKFYFSILKKNLDFGRSFEFTRMCRFNLCLWSFLKMFLTSVLNSVIAWQNDQGIEKLLARSLPHSQIYRKVLNFSIVFFFNYFLKHIPKFFKSFAPVFCQHTRPVWKGLCLCCVPVYSCASWRTLCIKW